MRKRAPIWPYFIVPLLLIGWGGSLVADSTPGENDGTIGAGLIGVGVLAVLLLLWHFSTR